MNGRSWRLPAFCAVSVVLLMSCAVQSTQPTIADLNDRKLQVEQVEGALDAETSRQKAVQVYRDLIANPPTGEVDPEALRRLADLRLEEDDDALADDASRSPQQAYAESMQLYQRLLQNNPEHQMNDRVLYQLARAYDNRGQKDEALAMLDQLVRRYPASPLVLESQFRRGEILFVKRSYPAAEDAFQAVIDTGDTNPFYEHALYKKGWSLFKQTNYQASIDPFMSVLQRKLPGGELQTDMQSLGRADRELAEDALRAISLGFSYEGGPASIHDYFSANAHNPYEDLIYSRLGAFYMDKEQFSDAAKTYESFAGRNPDSERAPDYQARVIDAFVKGKFPSSVLEAKKDYAKNYRLDGPYWQKRKPADRPEVVAALKSTVTDLANHYHAQAQQNKTQTDYREAETWYRSYLDTFPDDAKAPQMNFLLAEALYETKRYGYAALEYEKTAYKYPAHAKSSEAGYAALVSLEHYEKTLQGKEQAAVKERAIASTLRFADAFSEHPKTPVVLVKAADDLFKLNKSTEASRIAQRVVKQYPNTETGLRRTAWTVIAHTAFDGKDFLQAESAYQQVLTLMPTEDKHRNEVEERLAASIYKQGEVSQQQGDLIAAVDHFLRVGQVVPKSPMRATAEYDAAAALTTLKQWPRAALVLESFRASYPKHELQPEVTRRLAVAYQEGGQPLKAAVEFERMSEVQGGDPQMRQQAMLQAVELYEKGGDTGRSVDMLKTYIAKFPQPLEAAMEARQQLVDLYSKRNNATKARYWRQQIVAADAKAGPQRTERTKFLAANATLALAEEDHQAYRRVKLVEPLKQSLAKKKKLMKQAIDAYGKAANSGIESVTTAATFNTGDIYHDFSRALMDSQRPRGLNGEELEQYEILLEEQAFPFEEKAIDIYEVNIKRLSEGVYDKWIKRSIAALAELLPARYAKTERGEAVVEAIH